MVNFDIILLYVYLESNETSIGGKGSRKRPKKNREKYLNSLRTEELDYPDELDEQFFREAQYCLNEDIVNGECLFVSFEITIFIRYTNEETSCIRT